MAAKFMYLSLFISIILSLGFISILRKFAPIIHLIDIPGGRKKHQFPVPLVGGLAIYFTIIASVALHGDLGSDFGIIISWAGAVVFIGCLDDIKNVHWPFRLAVQLVAAWGVIYTTNIEVTQLGNYPLIGTLELGHYSTAFTIFAVIGITNAFNLIDGIDGLCGNLLLFPLSTLIMIGYVFSGAMDFYHIITAVSLLIFLAFNLNRNQKMKIFMGDSGSAGLGFILAFIVISSIQDTNLSIDPPLALWLLLIPISDTVHVIIKRALHRQSIFQPGTDHLHHRLIAAGYSRAKTLVYLLTAASAGITIGIILNSMSDLISLSLFFIIVAFLPSLLLMQSKKQTD